MFNFPEYRPPEQTTYSYTEEAIGIDEIVREELMIQYKLELEHGKDNVEFLDSLLQVIQFYCTGKQYRDFYFSIHGVNDDNAI